MIRRILFGMFGVAWGALCFLVGLYVTFPEDAARDRVMYEFGEWAKDDYALSIGELSLWRLSGVSLDDATVYTVKKGRKSKENPDPPKERTPIITFDTLSVGVAPFPMLMGKQAVAFVAEIYDGAFDGTYAQSEEVVELNFDASNIDLSKLPVATETMKLNLKGILGGESDLAFDLTDIKKSTGTLQLEFAGFGLDAGSEVAGFGLPEVNFTTASVAFEAKEGKLNVTEGTFDGDVLDATLSGEIVLNKKILRSRNRLDLVFSLPEDLDKLAQVAPDLKRARDDEGKYHLTISGTILSPSARFSKPSSKTVRKNKSGDDEETDGPLVGESEQSDEERRAARAQRIKDRRERLRKRREEAGQDDPVGARNDAQRDGPAFDEGEDMGPDGGPSMPPNFMPDGGGDGPLDLPPPDAMEIPPDVPGPEFEEP
jgi:type II secretion system protein N